MKTHGPRGWQPGQTLKRFADVAPSPASFDKAARTVDCCISMGSPVVRFYGTEILRISPEAVDLSRMQSGIIPLLDSHQQAGIFNALGRIQSTSFSRGGLMGQLLFNKTEPGEIAMGMVERNEIKGISAGYTVAEWQITDKKGRKVDPDDISFDDELTFEATRWELLEASLVAVPADASSGIRSSGSGVDRVSPLTSEADERHVAACLFRMNTRMRMVMRGLL
jgi:phage head maturation protease